MTGTIDFDALGVPPELRPVPGRRYRPIIRPLPSNRTITTGAAGGNGATIPHFRSPIFVSGQTELNLDQSQSYSVHDDHQDLALHGLRKKRKTPAFQLSSGRHEGFAVYEGDVVDGTDRHERLPPILPGDEHGHVHGRDCDLDEDDLHDGHYQDHDHDHDHDHNHDHGHERDSGDEDCGSDEDVPRQNDYTPSRNLMFHSPAKSLATRTCDFRKLQFLRRKAALITLFLDATSAIKTYWKDEKSSSTANISKNLLSKLPAVEAFEKLLPALEDVGVGDWPADRPGWRNGVDDTVTRRRLGVWRTTFAKRRKVREERKEIMRGGWAPEGSFELDIQSKAGIKARDGQKARASLQRLAFELRQILLSIKPRPPTIASDPAPKPAKPDADMPTKAKRRMDPKTDGTAPPAAAAIGAEAGDAGAGETPKEGGEMERTGSGSKEGSEAGIGGKKKPKKKKRSVLANQSNPHHVDNYRPSRTISSTADPTEPYPSHASLLFPPSMSFLSARPNGNRVRPSEDDYICCFCEYDLFYGSEARRKAAIRKRKQELKRKENIKNKAKNVAEGKGKTNEESDYEDGEGEGEGDDDVECEDQGYGKCSCGRALGPHGDKDHHLKPPDPDPNIPLPPPLLNRSRTTIPIPEMPKLDPLGTLHESQSPLRGSSPREVEDMSRASTPSID